MKPRQPRPLHPGAWWLWVIGLAIGASRVTNPIYLALMVAVVALVVALCRPVQSWSRGFGAYLVMGLVIVGIRIVFRSLLGGDDSGTVLFTIPEIGLPASAEGISLGGPVTTTDIASSAYQGARLATIIICIGAANVLADPKRLLKLFPSALYELGTALTVTLTVAPQLVESSIRVRQARRLRGDVGKGWHLVRDIAMPVMVDALDRSLYLASAMDARGYGRTSAVDPSRRRASGAMVLIGVFGVMVGTYGALDATSSAIIGVPLLLVSLIVAAVGVSWGSQQVKRTRYRPDPWRWPEWVISASGLIVGAGLVALSSSSSNGLNPSTDPLRWPTASVLVLLVISVGLVPAAAAPQVPK